MLLLSFISMKSYSQKKDTVVVIVDLKADYVLCNINKTPSCKFKYKNEISSHGKKEYNLIIRCHYYDSFSDSFNINLARYMFYTVYKGNGEVDVMNSIIEIDKTDLSRYNKVTSKWINKQRRRYPLFLKLGRSSADKICFIVFKHDVENSNKAKVRMYRSIFYHGIAHEGIE